MARPPLPLGTWGRIARLQVEPKKWRARASFRDFSGHTGRLDAFGATGAAAERALEARLRERVMAVGADITADTKLRDLGKLWLAEIESSSLAPQTIERYRIIVDKTISPSIGDVRVRESTVPTMDRYLKTLSAKTPATARTTKVVLSGMLGMAIRHGALLYGNPIRDVARQRSTVQEVRALSVDDVHTLRAGVRAWVAEPGQIGQRRSADIPDVVDILLATGARIGELVALRWDDVDLIAERPTVTIRGTAVSLPGVGMVRQDHTKSSSGFRTVTLPSFAVDTLLRRSVNASGDNQLNLVFPSARGTLRAPANIRRAWRDARAFAGFDWVVPHTFRKTVATLIDNERSTQQAASQLGHSAAAMTARHYVQRAAIAPDVSDVLEMFASE
ncbi:tyrosine-type recombinase/integrase [Diaminobutyricibacter sp. McL0618]|uniref:tyrosine-type recombinase/integrase n=1 Tax=Leifsonia sp. McL0618 TaxID=3415677 RepID=UPI003CE8A805